MPDKATAFISSILTIVILLLFAVLSVLTQILVLNGASERQGVAAMGISLGCQGVGFIIAALLAARLTNLFMTRFNWSRIWAVIVAVIAGTFLGGLISFFSVMISIPLAGIR